MGVTNNNDIYSSPHPHQNLSKMSKVVSYTPPCENSCIDSCWKIARSIHSFSKDIAAYINFLEYPNPAPPAAATARHKKRPKLRNVTDMADISV